MNFRCSRGHSNRFKGKKSEISRGVTVKCGACQEKIIIAKKSNGKIIGGNYVSSRPSDFLR